MAIMFPELSKNTVHIGIGGGKWCEVPMLNVGQFNEYQQIQFELAKFHGKETEREEMISAILDAREKLGKLACSVMPPELHNRVLMLDYKQLASLVDVLCTGKDDADQDAPEKKVVFPSQTSP